MDTTHGLAAPGKELNVIIEADENGVLHIPLDGPSASHRRFRLEADGSRYRLTPIDEGQPFYREMTDEEWIADFKAWAASAPHRDGLPIPDEALRRENQYD